MNNCELITVVVPVYNVEKYLERCLNSVVKQTYTNLEILLIDDGSTDCCSKICDEWAKKDNRIRVVHKKNAGLGMARNTGIDKATGKYICFFDSDDYIDSRTIEHATQILEKEKADLAVFGYFDISNNGEIVQTHIPVEKIEVYKGKQIQKELLKKSLERKKYDINLSAWSALYSMKMIRDTNWKFVSERNIISEDVYSLMEFYGNLNKVVLLNEALYYYCENEGSLTHTFVENRFKRINHFYIECTALADRMNYDIEVKKALAHPYIANIIGALKLLVDSQLEEKEKNKIIKNLLNDRVFIKALDNINTSNESIQRKILFFFMKTKMHIVCKWIIKLK